MSWGKVMIFGSDHRGSAHRLRCGGRQELLRNRHPLRAKDSGALTLAGHGKCHKGEKKVSIAKEGPRGVPGPRGEVGPQGTPGAPGGSEAPEPRHFVASKTTACAVETGSFCVTETGLCWDDKNVGAPYAPLSFRKDSDGFVHLEGAYENTSGEGACGEIDTWPVFYLPNGFKPSLGALKFSQTSCSNEPAWVKIEPNGRVGANYGCVDLSGIVFYADA